jgi:quaternary ammonium compound-resistance protein SugE
VERHGWDKIAALESAREDGLASLRTGATHRRKRPVPLAKSSGNRQGRPCLLSRRGGMFMAWLILFVAGLLEIGWAVGLKYTEGFTRPLPTVLTVLSMVASLGLLGLALRTLPLGTAYAIWTGIGTVGTALLGIILFGDPATVGRLVCIGLIVTGILGLKLLAG